HARRVLLELGHADPAIGVDGLHGLSLIRADFRANYSPEIGPMASHRKARIGRHVAAVMPVDGVTSTTMSAVAALSPPPISAPALTCPSAAADAIRRRPGA